MGYTHGERLPNLNSLESGLLIRNMCVRSSVGVMVLLVIGWRWHVLRTGNGRLISFSPRYPVLYRSGCRPTGDPCAGTVTIVCTTLFDAALIFIMIFFHCVFEMF